MSSVIDHENIKKSIEFILFFAMWDEELGPEILDFYPKSSILDLESLASNIFATYQFFWNKPDERYTKTKVTLPVVNINRKAHILLEVFHNREVGGGSQPFIVVLLRRLPSPSYSKLCISFWDSSNILERAINRFALS